MNHRYTLERKGQKKIACPQCGKKKCFVRYIDQQQGEYLPDNVGRCDREINCGYHYKPAEYFADSPDKKPVSDNWQAPTFTPKPKVNIPGEVMQSSLRGYGNNSFFYYLTKIFPARIAFDLVKMYNVGSSKHFGGTGCIFWFMNKAGQVRAGQVKQFDRAGHTASFTGRDGEARKMQTAVHEIIKRKHEKERTTPPVWLPGYIDQDLKIDCLFGEHLLSLPENEGKPVAIVEAPKTAIVAAAFFPEYVWLAVGSLSYLTLDRCRVLTGRHITLYPDLKALSKWQERAAGELSIIPNITVSTFLEDNATPEQIAQGFDLCDFLENIYYCDFLKDELYAALTDGRQLTAPRVLIRHYYSRGLSVAWLRRVHSDIRHDIAHNRLTIAA